MSSSVEPSEEIAEIGSFAVRDMGQTIAGTVLSVTERERSPDPTKP